MKRVLVTPRSLSAGHHPGLDRLEEHGFALVRPCPGTMPTEADLMAALPGCCGWIAGVEPVSPRVIEAATHLQVIARNGSGVDNLPMDMLDRRGIVVKRAMAANANGVAELALALIFAAFRHIPSGDRSIRAGAWPRMMGREIAGASIGIVGLGAIGAAMAQKCLALGAHVVGFDPFCSPTSLLPHPAFRQVASLGELVRSVDALTLHIPHAPGAAPLLDAALLAHARPDLTVINTARAGLIDPAAMLAALRNGRVRAYATDVFATEPPALSNLLQHESCILSAHIGGLTIDSVERITRLTVDNLLAGLSLGCA